MFTASHHDAIRKLVDTAPFHPTMPSGRALLGREFGVNIMSF